RPPRTYAAQQQTVDRQPRSTAVLARPLTELAAVPATQPESIRLEKVTPAYRTAAARQVKETRQLADTRARQEFDSAAKGPLQQTKEKNALKLTLPHSPVIAPTGRPEEKSQTPPALPKVPTAEHDKKANPPTVTRPKPEDRLEPPRGEPPGLKPTPPP